jgi:hypothetical protein
VGGLAFFSILGACRPTLLAKPRLGEDEPKNSQRSLKCRIFDTS